MYIKVGREAALNSEIKSSPVLLEKNPLIPEEKSCILNPFASLVNIVKISEKEEEQEEEKEDDIKTVKKNISFIIYENQEDNRANENKNREKMQQEQKADKGEINEDSCRFSENITKSLVNKFTYLKPLNIHSKADVELQNQSRFM